MVTKEQMQRLGRVRETLRTDRERWDSLWLSIAKRISPYHGDWSDSSPTSEGMVDIRDNFDNTAMKASNRLADGIQGYACGRTISWFRLAYEREDLNEVDEYKKYLQKSEKIMYKDLAKSNFYDECRSFIKCGADFGTAIMLRENNNKRNLPCYRTLHPKNALIQENAFGEVDTLFRDFWLSTEDIKDYFKGCLLPSQISQCEELTKLWKIIHYVAASTRYQLDIKGKEPYVSLYYAEIDKEFPIKEERFKYKPFYAWRWARSYIGDIWGVDAPGMLELANANQLNGMQKDKFRLSQLTARPPIKRTEGLLVNFVPGGLIDIRSGQDFQPQPITGNLAWLTDDIKSMKDSTRETYYSDFFLVLTENIDRMKTATEVAGLQDEKSALLSSFFGRLATEFLEPVLEDLFASEITFKKLDAPPSAIASSDLAVDFISPLAMIQKRAHELSTTKAFMAEILPLAEIRPDVLDKIDIDKYVDVVADAGSVNQKVIRKDSDVADIRKARIDQQNALAKQQMQIEQAKAGAEVYSLGGKAPEKGSASAQMQK
jgi:hypothetical protein